MPEPTAAHWAAAAEAVTSGPMTERDITARVASLLAHHEALVTDADRAATIRAMAADALASPKLAAFATELRARGWRPPCGFSCGCNPAAGLCPSHTALRDVEAVAVNADRTPLVR